MLLLCCLAHLWTRVAAEHVPSIAAHGAAEVGNEMASFLRSRLLGVAVERPHELAHGRARHVPVVLGVPALEVDADARGAHGDHRGHVPTRARFVVDIAQIARMEDQLRYVGGATAQSAHTEVEGKSQ